MAARKHLGCPNLHGIEADGTNRIHLNEYIYGVRHFSNNLPIATFMPIVICYTLKVKSFFLILKEILIK